MINTKREPKKQIKINMRPILYLLIGLGLFSSILLFTLFEAAKDAKPSGRYDQPRPVLEEKDTEGGKTLNSDENDILAVVREINTEDKRITLYDIEALEEHSLTYTGGSDITDKFGQVISINQIPIGLMVDAGYQKSNGKLLRLQISTKAWEYAGVNNLSINKADRIMKIARTKYKYTEDLLVLDGEEKKTVDDLAEQDELTIRGYGETIWSIIVTKGHGTVKLTDYEDFLGGNITVGYEAMQQIKDNISIPVREGDFNLTVENGKYSGTKNITVERNKETLVSLKGLGPQAERHGLVTFAINPSGAELSIDGVTTSYLKPIELTYGNHKIEVSLGGYTSYKGILKVDTAGKKIRIDLPEASGKDKINIIETDDDTVKNEPEAGYNEWKDPTEEAEEDPDDSDISTGNNNNNNNSSDNDGEGTFTEPKGDYTVDEDHLIYVQKPAGASVYLNGKFMGISPGSFKKVIGSHVLTFIKEGYETMSYTIEVENDGMDTYLSFSDLVRKK